MLTELEEAQSLYSDMYKDVNGFRPRSVSTECWNNLEWLQNKIEGLSCVLDQMLLEEKVETENNIKKFEDLITSVIENGAKNRETAIKWLHDSNDTCGDNDMLCFVFGLPYSYLG